MYKIYAEMYILGEFRLYAVILRIERKFCKQKSRDGSRPIQILNISTFFLVCITFLMQINIDTPVTCTTSGLKYSLQNIYRGTRFMFWRNMTRTSKKKSQQFRTFFLLSTPHITISKDHWIMVDDKTRVSNRAALSN